MSKKEWIIKDWADNLMFDGKEFSSVEDAHEFLTNFVENKYPDTKDNEDRFDEEMGEFYIVFK